MTDDPCADFGSGECQEALRELYLYLDGHLTIERRTVIRTHLDACGHCGSTFEFEFELGDHRAGVDGDNSDVEAEFTEGLFQCDRRHLGLFCQEGVGKFLGFIQHVQIGQIMRVVIVLADRLKLIVNLLAFASDRRRRVDPDRLTWSVIQFAVDPMCHQIPIGLLG